MKTRQHLSPHGRMPPPTSQVPTYIHVCADSYVVTTLKKFNKKALYVFFGERQVNAI